MKKNYIYYALMAVSLLVAACGSDDDSSPRSVEVNKNANGRDKSEYAVRTEMPKVMKGTNYVILVKHDDEIGVNYIVEWDCIKRAQRWTCWEWNSRNNTKGWERKKWDGASWMGKVWTGDPFQPDEEIPADFRTELSDYKGSGYDRGHICASEDRICSQNVNGQTFFLSNMHPQINKFNAQVWAKMESKVRTWRDATVGNGGTLYVCKGGTLYDVFLNGKTVAGTLTKNPSTQASNENLRMPVPKYFFMAVMKKTAAGMYCGMAFWAEHKADNSSNLTPYMITINELEQRTGYDFFCNLPDVVEEQMEATLDVTEWK